MIIERTITAIITIQIIELVIARALFYKNTHFCEIMSAVIAKFARQLTESMMREDDFSRLELDLRGCVSNYRYFRSLLEPSTKLLVLVKANAYGHGAVEFAAMMQRAGADYLAVAYPVEGLELRQNGISLPIIVLTAGTDFYPEIVQTRMEPSIPNLESLDAFCSYLISQGLRDYPIHIKLDNAHPEVKVKSMFSHLCVAEDPEQDSFTQAQFDLFERNSQTIIDGIGYRPMRHILNSAGIERFPEHQYDMVRLGIGIYGISALPGVQRAPATPSATAAGARPPRAPSSPPSPWATPTASTVTSAAARHPSR